VLIAFTILFAVGWVAFFGGWRCYSDPDSAGVFAHPAAALVAFAFLAGMVALIVLGSGSRLSGVIAAGLFLPLYGPLLWYHLTRALTGTVSALSQPAPEPADPFERARAAEERGDTEIAVERYLWLLEREPSHEAARKGLAELLARMGRAEWSKDVIEKGMSLAEAGPEARAGWHALRLKWQEGKALEAPPDEKPRFRGLEDSPTPRLDMHAEAQSTGDDESAVPFDEGDEEEEADGAEEEDDDRPIPFP
jgi:hypothetical protein